MDKSLTAPCRLAAHCQRNTAAQQPSRAAAPQARERSAGAAAPTGGTAGIYAPPTLLAAPLPPPPPPSFWRRGSAPGGRSGHDASGNCPVPPGEPPQQPGRRRPAFCAQTGGHGARQHHPQRPPPQRRAPGTPGERRGTTRSRDQERRGADTRAAGNRPDATPGGHAAAHEPRRQGRVGTAKIFPSLRWRADPPPVPKRGIDALRDYQGFRECLPQPPLAWGWWRDYRVIYIVPQKRPRQSGGLVIRE